MTVGWDKLLIITITFAVLTLTKTNPAYVILAASIGGVVMYR
jgi:hypothetical protein